MSQENDYQVTEEEILHNTSRTSIITEISVTHQRNEQDIEDVEDQKVKMKSILSAKYSDVDATNRLYIAKQKELIDAKIELQFDLIKVDKDIEEMEAKIKHLTKMNEESEAKKYESNNIISQENVDMKRVEKQLITKSLIFEKILPSQIEKQALTVNNLESAINMIQKTWSAKSQKIQNLMEIKTNILEDINTHTVQLAALEKDELKVHNHHQEILLHNQEKTSNLQALKEKLKCATEEQIDISRKLTNENVLLSELMYKEFNVQEDFLSMNNKEQEKINLFYKTLEEKKAAYFNDQNCLLPTFQSKVLENQAILFRTIDEKNNLDKKIDDLNQSEFVQTQEIQKIEADINLLIFNYKEENEKLKEDILKLDESILVLNRENQEMQKSKNEAEMILKTCSEEVKNLIDTEANEKEIIDSANKKLIELTDLKISRRESNEQLQNSLLILPESENIDIEKTKEKINTLNNHIDCITLEISDKEKIYSEELTNAEKINLVALQAKLKCLSKEKNGIINKIRTKTIQKDSLAKKVTKVDLSLQELLRSSKKSFKNACKVKQWCPPREAGILKRLGEKSPAKHVHFVAGVAGSTTEDASEKMDTDLIGKVKDKPVGNFGKDAPDSPPTRIPSKKGKYVHNNI